MAVIEQSAHMQCLNAVLAASRMAAKAAVCGQYHTAGFVAAFRRFACMQGICVTSRSSADHSLMLLAGKVEEPAAGPKGVS